MDELRETLAAIEHERWAAWQSWMHGRCERDGDGSLLIPAELVARWERQIATPYADLSEAEQRGGREQVDRYWPLIAETARKAAAWDALRERVAEARARFPGPVVYLLLDADDPTAYVVDTGTWPHAATPLERRRREEADHA